MDGLNYFWRPCFHLHNLSLALHASFPFYSSIKNTTLPNHLLEHFLVGHLGLKNSCHIIQHTSRYNLRPSFMIMVTVVCIKIWKTIPTKIYLMAFPEAATALTVTAATAAHQILPVSVGPSCWIRLPDKNFPLTQKTKHTNIKMEHMEYESHCTIILAAAP